MSIYQRTKVNYRKLYKEFYGEIPKDEDGRSFEIHHKDGNSNNNSKENLIALSIQDHYNIHFEQGDFGACIKIATKMKLMPGELSKIVSLNNKKMVEEGRHPFMTDQFKVKRSELSTDRAVALLEEGKHNFQNPKIMEKAKQSRERTNNNKLKNGIHHLQAKGKNHPSYDHTVYKFYNKELSLTIESTQYDFRTKYNLDSGAVCSLVKGDYKSTKGWYLVK